MTTSPQSTPAMGHATRRRAWPAESSRVGWALTAVTCLVLAIGVGMIRQVVRIDRPDPVTGEGQDDAAALAPRAPSRLVLRPADTSDAGSGDSPSVTLEPTAPKPY